MLEAERFYEAAHNGGHIDPDLFSRYANSFENVVLWGGGYLGTEIGKKFLDLKLPISAYWDMRAAELEKVNGIDVIEPFQGGFDKERTLVVFCITNSFVRDRVRSQLSASGFQNVLTGEFIYQGLICPMEEFDAFKKCRDSLACDAYTCLRNDKFFEQHLLRLGNTAELLFRNVTIVINQKCTLSCKHCYAYTNSYPSEKRVNFPVEQIKKDIDMFFDAVDGVKFIPLIGGETFLHPNVSEIVKKILEKRNFGVLNVTTNGVCKMSPRQLEGLQDDRVQVVFSNYKDCLSSQQNDIFDRNVELVKSSGARVILLNSTPQWVVPTTLSNKYYSVEKMIRKRAACATPLNCKYLKNGRFYPCTIADSINSIGVADYQEDYVELTDNVSSSDLRRQIQALVNLSYYKSCGHCDGTCGHVGLASKAGEQGYGEYVHLEEAYA